MAEKKGKRHVSDNAQLMSEWNWDKNTDISPYQVTQGSNKKAWWKCSEGHEWETVIATRTKGHGCPYCSGRFATKENNLEIKALRDEQIRLIYQGVS